MSLYATGLPTTADDLRVRQATRALRFRSRGRLRGLIQFRDSLKQRPLQPPGSGVCTKAEDVRCSVFAKLAQGQVVDGFELNEDRRNRVPTGEIRQCPECLFRILRRATTHRNRRRGGRSPPRRRVPRRSPASGSRPPTPPPVARRQSRQSIESNPPQPPSPSVYGQSNSHASVDGLARPRSAAEPSRWPESADFAGDDECAWIPIFRCLKRRGRLGARCLRPELPRLARPNRRAYSCA